MDNLQVFETGEVVGHLSVSCLILLRNRNAVTVVLNNKDNRQAFRAGTVYRFIHETFGSGGFTVGSDSNSFVFVVNHRTSDTSRMQVVCTCCGRDIFYVPLRFGEMVRHMPSGTSQVGRLRDTVQYNFFRSHSGR